MCGYTTIPDEIDNFGAENLSSDYHNGPKCVNCGFEFCEHCSPEGWNTKCGTESLESDDSKLDSRMMSMIAGIKKNLK